MLRRPAPVSKTKIVAIVAGIIVVLGVAAVIWVGQGRRTRSAPAPGEGNGASPAIAEAGKVKGAPTAPVLVEVFSDFNCSHCADAALNFEKKRLQPYLAAGKIRFQFRHFLVGGIQSYNAAVAAECAGRQEKFWPYHDQLFTAQDPSRALQYSEQDIEKFRQVLVKTATGLGLDTTTFKTCLYNEETKADVAGEHALGTQKKVNSTPTYFIDGVKVEGATDAVIAQIEKALR